MDKLCHGKTEEPMKNKNNDAAVAAAVVAAIVKCRRWNTKNNAKASDCMYDSLSLSLHTFH